MIVTIESKEEFMKLVDGSAFTFTGLNPDQENFEFLEHVLKEVEGVVNQDIELCFYIWTGAQMNDWNNLVKDPYPADLHFVALDLNQFNNIAKLAMIKHLIGARWLDDIYDNNNRREGNI